MVKDCRASTVAITLVLIIGAGMLLRYWPQSPGAPLPTQPVAAGPTRSKTPAPVPARQTALSKHFQVAVSALQDGHYQQALGDLHQVLRLAPKLPEAHVNMGFTLLGLGRAQAAADFFATAIELRPSQVNAYYGLALAQEALGDLPTALGAMRSYVHLTAADDPRLPVARAALWEWDSQLARSATRSALPTAPESD